MRCVYLFLASLFFSLNVFSQARELAEEGYKTVYVIVITKDGNVNHVIKEGAQISTKVDGRTVNGRWFFKSFPDVVAVVGKDREILTEIALNKEEPLKIVTPQAKSGPSIGIGIGPVSVSNIGPGFQSFNMTKYKAEIVERFETKEEKLSREYYEKKEAERKEKEAAKEAKRAAKRNK